MALLQITTTRSVHECECRAQAASTFAINVNLTVHAAPLFNKDRGCSIMSNCKSLDLIWAAVKAGAARAAEAVKCLAAMAHFHCCWTATRQLGVTAETNVLTHTHTQTVAARQKKGCLITLRKMTRTVMTTALANAAPAVCCITCERAAAQPQILSSLPTSLGAPSSALTLISNASLITGSSYRELVPLL